MDLIPVFKMQIMRFLSRLELRFAITIVLLMMTVAFVECCLRFNGFDVNALPSAAYGWIWNMDPIQNQTMRILAYFLIFIIAASAFADNFLSDLKRGVTASIVCRCSLSSYIISNALISFFGGFVVILIPLAVSQLLSFLIFPITGSFEGHFNTPAYVCEDANGTLFPDVAFNHPYLNNVIYIVYAPFWAGAMALLSFALSLFIRNRLAIIGLPTVFALASWYLIPGLGISSVVLTHFRYLYPGPQTEQMSELYFFAAPIIILVISVALICIRTCGKRDILL